MGHLHIETLYIIITWVITVTWVLCILRHPQLEEELKSTENDIYIHITKTLFATDMLYNSDF